MGFFKRFTRPRVELSFKSEKHEFFLGEEAKAIVEVNSEEEFDTEGITVGLNCHESVKKTRMVSKTDAEGETKWYKQSYWDKANLSSDSLKICDEMHLTVGFSKEFLFAIQLSSVGRQTFHGVDRNLKWSLWAVMKTKGQRSIEIESEIIVAKPSAMPKEIVKEVVLIPCKYCGGLMPQTSLFCPNCGAKRQA